MAIPLVDFGEPVNYLVYNKHMRKRLSNSTHKLNQSGFSIVELVIILAVLGVLGFVGFRVYQNVGDGSDSGSFFFPEESSESGSQLANSWTDKCEGSGTIDLTHAPLKNADTDHIVPLGSLAGPHVTPIDHLYFYPPNVFSGNQAKDAFPVYMMGDGYIKEIQRRPRGQGKEDFRIVVQHTCTFYSYFDLITVLDQKIIDAFPDIQDKDAVAGHFFVKAGEEIGRVGGQSIDTAVYNTEKPLDGFMTPKLYSSEYWKQYTDSNFFDYFPKDIRNQMLAKNKRTAEPRAGKIDYDQPGKLIGNWFEENTNGYAGVQQGNDQGDFSGRGYWTTHLAFVPDVFEPDKMVASIGDFDGKPIQFSVKGNTPNFANVDSDSGVVKYELIQQKRYNSDDPIQIQQNVQDRAVLGVVLVQVMDDEKLKFEVFPDKTSGQVRGFSNNAKTYER